MTLRPLARLRGAVRDARPDRRTPVPALAAPTAGEIVKRHVAVLRDQAIEPDSGHLPHPPAARAGEEQLQRACPHLTNRRRVRLGNPPCVILAVFGHGGRVA